MSSTTVNTIPELAALILDVKSELIGTMNNMCSELESKFFGQISRIEDSVKTIESRQDLLDDKLEEIERRTHLTDLLLDGIPWVQGEDLTNIYGAICNKIGFLTKEHTLSSIFRIRNNKQSSHQPTIVLKFISTTARNEFFRSYMKCLDLNLKDIGFDTGLRIYIKESLTKRNADIFRKAVTAKKDQQLFGVHTYNGHVYVRINKEDQPIRIISAEHFFRITAENLSTNTSSKRKDISGSSIDLVIDSDDAKVIKPSKKAANIRVNRENVFSQTSVSSPFSASKPSSKVDNPFRPSRSVSQADSLPKRHNSNGTLDRYLSTSKETVFIDESTK